MHDPLQLLILAVISLCGGFIQGGIGFGYSILAVPVVSVMAGAKIAAAVTSIPAQAGSIMLSWQGRGAGLPVSRTDLLAILIPGAIGTAFGALLLASLDPSAAQLILGVLVLLFVLTHRLRQDWQPTARQGTVTALLAGAAAGTLSGMAGIAGPVLAPYTHSLRLDKERFVSYLSLLFLAFSVYRLVAYFGAGLYTWELVGDALLVTPIALFGIWLGARFRNRIDAVLFNRIVLLVLFFTSLDLIRRGLHLF